MDTQTIIAAIIILAAFGYVGFLLSKKVKAFAPKTNCGGDCGCGDKSKTR